MGKNCVKGHYHVPTYNTATLPCNLEKKILRPGKEIAILKAKNCPWESKRTVIHINKITIRMNLWMH